MQTALALQTSGDIARLLGEDAARIRHILDSRRIEPAGRAGLTRLYGGDAVERVRTELASLKRRQTRAPEGVSS